MRAEVDLEMLADAGGLQKLAPPISSLPVPLEADPRSTLAEAISRAFNDWTCFSTTLNLPANDTPYDC